MHGTAVAAAAFHWAAAGAAALAGPTAGLARPALSWPWLPAGTAAAHGHHARLHHHHVGGVVGHHGTARHPHTFAHRVLKKKKISFGWVPKLQ
jgi:hypothetical protein